MRRFIAGVLTAVALVGCDQGTPGGPGVKPMGTTETTTTTTTPHDGTVTTPEATTTTETTTTPEKPMVGTADDTFTLSMPTLSTSLKQGETKSVTVGITRGKNFDQDVTLKLADLPQGVTIEPAEPTIKHGESEATLSVKAADDAALGDFTINVVGHPAEGADAQNKLTVTVTEK